MSATFSQLVQSLGARAGGNGWYNACCPAHADRSPSFSFRRGDYKPVVFHCFAHCTDEEIIAALEVRDLWPLDDDGIDVVPPPPRAFDRLQRILQIDSELVPLAGSLAQRYLRRRGIKIVPADLGYHKHLWHPWSASEWPAMVACVRDVSGRPMALQATFLHRVVPSESSGNFMRKYRAF